MVMVMVMVNVDVDLYSAIITKVSNALNTLVSGEKPGFQTTPHTEKCTSHIKKFTLTRREGMYTYTEGVHHTQSGAHPTQKSVHPTRRGVHPTRAALRQRTHPTAGAHSDFHHTQTAGTPAHLRWAPTNSRTSVARCAWVCTYR